MLRSLIPQLEHVSIACLLTSPRVQVLTLSILCTSENGETCFCEEARRHRAPNMCLRQPDVVQGPALLLHVLSRA